MEILVNMFNGSFQGRRVWLSGHTGFKGAWLAHWLLDLGAEVKGFALPPEGGQKLHDGLDLARRMDSRFGDVRDRSSVAESIRSFRPDFVFHLAAQSLVRRSYAEPASTFEANVMGTVNVLEALRPLDAPCAAVIVTSDKCYENPEAGHPLREGDRLGGHDPYSASKGMAEMATDSYRRSFFGPDSPISVASARAGNVIGGGDMAADRIVPDMVRARASGEVLKLRYPQATRPWQHVLEPLSGYLRLAALMSTSLGQPGLAELRSGFNFGPEPGAVLSVGELVRRFQAHWGDLVVSRGDMGPHEAGSLSLDIAKARELLEWSPSWSVDLAIRATALWEGSDPRASCDRDLGEYCRSATAARQTWAR